MKRSLFSAALILSIVSIVSAKDFILESLPNSDKPMFDLTQLKGQTYYDVVHQKIAPAMTEEGKDHSGSNDAKLRKGKGVSVKLADSNFNIHINFPASEMGGRSYGWTKGGVGDWTDEMYLRNLGKASKDPESEVRNFYKVIIQMLAASDTSGLEQLSLASQRVATNFLAIYTAEEYRRIQKASTHWDDALLQVTLLGAFHGGQTQFEMFYTGAFTDKTKTPASGVYENGKEGQLFASAKEKPADMTDYHQYSYKLPGEQGAGRSGINLTRHDFEKMGAALTQALSDNENLKKIERITGIRAGSNIIKELAAAFATGKINAKDADLLSDAVADFMIDSRRAAKDISTGLRLKNPALERTLGLIDSSRAQCLKFYSNHSIR